MTSSAPFDTESPRPLSSPTANFDQGAGPSVSVPPPECMKPDHLTQEDLAKLPTFKPHKLGFLHKKKSKNDTNQTKKVDKGFIPEPVTEVEPHLQDLEVSDVPFVRLDGGVLYSAGLEEDYDKDVYRWAVLYENQRGYVNAIF
jgi:hypothetical protein